MALIEDLNPGATDFFEITMGGLLAIKADRESMMRSIQVKDIVFGT